MKKDQKTLQDHFIVSQNLIWIGGVIMLSSILFQHTSFFWIPWILGFLIMIASVVYSARYFKCPHCGTKLDPRRKVPNYCLNCGKSLYEEYISDRY